jgi:diguanylate cyclase (GGDEF)-like protein
MNKHHQTHRIINYSPWPARFSLLEIFIFLMGIFVTVFLFRFISSLNTLSGNLFIRRFNMILSLGTGCVLFIISLILWRKWTVIQNTTAQKQVEEALRSANQKLSEGIAELEQRTQEMDLFRQMIDLLSACPTIEEAYKIIEDQLGKLNLADSGALYMMKPSHNSLQQVAAWGENTSNSPIFPPSDCWGLRRGSLHIAEFNCLPVDRHHANPLICPHISSTVPADYLCLPLVAQGETLGILHLRHLINMESSDSAEASKHWFTPQRVQRINILAGSLALAIANLTLRTSLRQQSIRDPLTGLYNRRYLEETLERELLRASRSKKNVGLMMIDIDHFKQFNDIYGHPAADAVLSAISHLFSSCIRREDLVCRYGGEEILIMLPETNLETTCQRAEVIREKVAQLNVQYQGQLLEPVSISIGVGIFPDHGQTPEALIRRADKALYRAKNNGRNRVEVVTPNLAEPRHDAWQKLHSHAEDHRISQRVPIPQ